MEQQAPKQPPEPEPTPTVPDGCNYTWGTSTSPLIFSQVEFQVRNYATGTNQIYVVYQVGSNSSIGSTIGLPYGVYNNAQEYDGNVIGAELGIAAGSQLYNAMRTGAISESQIKSLSIFNDEVQLGSITTHNFSIGNQRLGPNPAESRAHFEICYRAP